MSFLERIGIARPKVQTVKEVEIIDQPKASVRADTLRFASTRPHGFTDDDLVEFLGRPGVARTTLLTPRVRLVREGLIVKAGNSLNARGNAVNLYKSAEFIEGPAREPAKRLTYSQLRRKLTTAELEISVLKAKLAKYEPDEPVYGDISDETARYAEAAMLEASRPIAILHHIKEGK